MKENKGIFIAFIILSVVLITLIIVTIFVISSGNNTKNNINKESNKNTVQVSGNDNENFQENLMQTSKLEIGTIVRYEPNGKYEWKAEYYSNNKEAQDKLLDSSPKGEFNITKWKVLSIDEENGKIELVTDNTTKGTVPLEFAQGYNNGVKLLNDACNSLYGNKEKMITARSINIEDIEKLIDKEVLEKQKNKFIDSKKFDQNKQLIEAYTDGKNAYPIIYSKERKSVIDEYCNEEGLDESEQEEFINLVDSKENLGKITAQNSIRPYKTEYNIKNSILIDELGNYQEIIIPKYTPESYWIASRCIGCSNFSANFYIRKMNKGNLHWVCLTYSGKDDAGNKESNGLFPVVTLNSNLIEYDKDLKNFCVK